MPISKKQLQIMAFPYSKYEALICDGAIRSGKTVFMMLAFVDDAMRRYNNQRFGICGKTVDSTVKNIIMPYMGLNYAHEKYRIQWKRSDKLLVVSTGKKTNYFELFGGKDESSFMLIQGRTLAGVLLDEVALQPRSFVEQALARCSVAGSKLWFKVDGYELMYPGDRSAPGYLVYNCRCTTIAVLPDVDTSDAQRWSIDPETGERKLVSDMTYQEWAGWKEKEQKTVANSVQSGTIKEKSGLNIGVQFFANRSIPKYSDKQLEKSIKNWNIRIAEHKDKIAHPEIFEKDWNLFEERHRDGEIKHWQHEIQVFEDNIRQAEEELRKRKE